MIKLNMLDRSKVMETCRVSTNLVGMFLFLYICKLLVIDIPQRAVLCFSQRVMHHCGKYKTQIIHMHALKLITSNIHPMILFMFLIGR